MKSGLVAPDDTVSDHRVVPVDHRAERADVLAALAEAIAIDRRVASQIVAAFPSPFDYRRGISLMTHKYASIKGLDLRSTLRARLGRSDLDIRFVHDAAAAGAGEVALLSPTGTTLVLTLGTGMGAALFDGHTLIEWRHGIEVSELWSTPVKHAARAGEAIADDVFSASGLARRLSVVSADLPSAVADTASAVPIAEWGQQLGAFIEHQAHVLSVDRVVIGGGVAGAFDLFGAATRSVTGVEIAQARLGANAALVGAAALAFGAGA